MSTDTRGWRWYHRTSECLNCGCLFSAPLPMDMATDPAICISCFDPVEQGFFVLFESNAIISIEAFCDELQALVQ